MKSNFCALITVQIKSINSLIGPYKKYFLGIDYAFSHC